jgi:hypothetical protein
VPQRLSWVVHDYGLIDLRCRKCVVLRGVHNDCHLVGPGEDTVNGGTFCACQRPCLVWLVVAPRKLLRPSGYPMARVHHRGQAWRSQELVQKCSCRRWRNVIVFKVPKRRLSNLVSSARLGFQCCGHFGEDRLCGGVRVRCGQYGPSDHKKVRAAGDC